MKYKKISCGTMNTQLSGSPPPAPVCEKTRTEADSKAQSQQYFQLRERYKDGW